MQKAFRGSTSPYDIFTHTQEAPAPGPGSCSPPGQPPAVLVCFPQVLFGFFSLIFLSIRQEGMRDVAQEMRLSGGHTFTCFGK